MKTILLGGSTKKIHCRWEGSEWKEEWRLLLGGSTKKINKCRWEGGEWKEEWRLYCREGAQFFFLPVRGVCVCVGESVKILTPAGGPTAEIIKSEVRPSGQHRKQNKNKQTIKTQGEVCIASSTCKKDKCDTPSKASEARCTLYRIKVRFQDVRHHLTRKKRSFKAQCPQYPAKM